MDSLGFNAEKTNQLDIRIIIKKSAEKDLSVDDILLGLLIALQKRPPHKGLLYRGLKTLNIIAMIAGDSLRKLLQLGFPLGDDPGLKEIGFNDIEESREREYRKSATQ